MNSFVIYSLSLVNMVGILVVKLSVILTTFNSKYFTPPKATQRQRKLKRQYQVLISKRKYSSFSAYNNAHTDQALIFISPTHAPINTHEYGQRICSRYICTQTNHPSSKPYMHQHTVHQHTVHGSKKALMQKHN